MTNRSYGARLAGNGVNNIIHTRITGAAMSKVTGMVWGSMAPSPYSPKMPFMALAPTRPRPMPSGWHHSVADWPVPLCNTNINGKWRRVPRPSQTMVASGNGAPIRFMPTPAIRHQPILKLPQMVLTATSACAAAVCIVSASSGDIVTATTPALHNGTYSVVRDWSFHPQKCPGTNK